MIHDRTGLFISKTRWTEIRNLNIRTRIAVILILETESAKQIIQISAMIMSVGARERDDDLDEDLWSTFRATSKLNESVEKYTAKKNIRWMTNEDYPQN